METNVVGKSILKPEQSEKLRKAFEVMIALCGEQLEDQVDKFTFNSQEERDIAKIEAYGSFYLSVMDFALYHQLENARKNRLDEKIMMNENIRHIFKVLEGRGVQVYMAGQSLPPEAVN